MRKYEFYQLDVFTDKKFSGNPLAVFPAASGLNDSEMQQIANEMNLSETVFVLSSETALRRLRIFTPQSELPLAGHPVVGTWNLLARLGITPQAENELIEIKQELNLGVLPVEIIFSDSEPSQIIMTQGEFSVGNTISDAIKIKRLAEALGIDAGEIRQTETLPVQVVSTGIKALAVPLKTLKAIKKCKINAGLLSEIYLSEGAAGVYIFSFETIEHNSAVHARFFAPADGIAEDAATGSAAGSLSGYLMFHEALKVKEFTIEQGDFMQRPSRIFAKVTGEKENVKKVKIGGQSVIIAKGEIYLD